MLRGIPLIFKKNRYYAVLKRRLPKSLRLYLQGDINAHKQKLLKNAVNEKPILPSLIGLELTNHCNAKCTFCTQPDIMIRPKDTMTLEVIKRVVDQIRKYNVPAVMLGGMGEPFMWKEIINLIKKLSDSGVHVLITTNGSMFHRFTPKEIIERQTNIIIIDTSCKLVFNFAIFDVIIVSPFFFMTNLKNVTSISLEKIIIIIQDSTTLLRKSR